MLRPSRCLFALRSVPHPKRHSWRSRNAAPRHAPQLAGLYGRSVQLSDGRQVTADDGYIRDSILQPKRDITAGFEPIMPSYAGLLDDGEIQSLTAYIRSLASRTEKAND